jgi:hypothetical protein
VNSCSPKRDSGFFRVLDNGVMKSCLTWLAACAVAASWTVAMGQSAAPAAAPANLAAEAARAVGVNTCLPAVTRLSALAIAGSRTHDVLVDWDHAQPGGGPFFSLLGISFGGQSLAATITAIPDSAKGCTVSAERISVAPFTCQSIAEVELKGYTATRLLPTFTVYTMAQDPGSSVSLIDSPPTCLVIRRYVQYNWKEPAGAPSPNR